jgi:hypothetical protein
VPTYLRITAFAPLLAIMFLGSMKRYLSTSSRRAENMLTSFLLVAVLLSSSAPAGGNPTDQTARPSSVGAAATRFRNYALTTVPCQRIARDTSKLKSVKHPIPHAGLSPRESDVPANSVHQLLVTSQRSILYLSFRSSRPSGRAPPASA